MLLSLISNMKQEAETKLLLLPVKERISLRFHYDCTEKRPPEGQSSSNTAITHKLSDGPNPTHYTLSFFFLTGWSLIRNITRNFYCRSTDTKLLIRLYRHRASGQTYSQLSHSRQPQKTDRSQATLSLISTIDHFNWWQQEKLSWRREFLNVARHSVPHCPTTTESESSSLLGSPIWSPKNALTCLLMLSQRYFFFCLFVIMKHKKGTVLSAFIKARLGFRLKFFCVTDPNVSTA